MYWVNMWKWKCESESVKVKVQKLKCKIMKVWKFENNQVSCKCNAAMYWVNMPGMDEGNNPVPGIFYVLHFDHMEIFNEYSKV